MRRQSRSRLLTLPLLLLATLFGAAFGAAEMSAQDLADRARMAYENKEYLEAARLFAEAVKEDDDDEDLLTEAGDAYMALEYYDTAVSYYERAYNEDSRDGTINRKFGMALSMLGEHDEAIEKLRRAYKYDDQSLESRLALGAGYLAIGTDSLGQAEIAILGADKAYPDNPRVKAAIGDLYFQRGIYNLSEEFFKEAIELDPNLIQSRIGLAISYRKMGQRGAGNEYYTMALKQANEVTRSAPSEPAPWRLQGEILRLLKKYPEAIRSLNMYRQLRPDDPQGDFLVAITASEAKAYSAAIDPAMAILSRQDERSRLFHSEARAIIARGYYSQAQQARDENPDSARYFYGKSAQAYMEADDSVMTSDDLIFQGNAWLWQGDTARGVAVWGSIIDVYPDSCDLAYKMTRTFYKLGRYEDLLTSLDKLEGACGDRIPASSALLRGLSLMQLERTPEAIVAFQEGIGRDSTELDLYYWMMNAMVSEKMYDEIPAYAAAALRNIEVEGNEQKLGKINYFAGIAEYNRKDMESAIAFLDAATDLQGDDAQAYLYKAIAYHTLKDKDGACTNYRKTLQYDPDNKTATSNLGKLGC